MMRVIDEKLFKARDNAELLGLAYSILKEKGKEIKEKTNYDEKFIEEVIEAKMESLKMVLARSENLKAGTELYCSPGQFFEELFWEAIVNSPKTLVVEVFIGGAGKFLFKIKGEYPNYEFETEPVDINELIDEIIEPNSALIPSIFRETINDNQIPVKFKWNEEDAFLFADIIDKGVYVFHINEDGLIVQKIK
jgi:hypothetical protein